MIEVGMHVRCKEEINVPYERGHGKYACIPAGALGVVEDLGVFHVNVAWLMSDAGTLVFKVWPGDLEVLPPTGTVAAIAQLLRNSWKDIGYEYDKLSDLKKGLITPAEFEALREWLKASPDSR